MPAAYPEPLRSSSRFPDIANRTFAAAPFALLLLAVTAPARAATIVDEPARRRFGVLRGREAGPRFRPEERKPQLHSPLFLLAVLPLPMTKFVLPWHSRLPRTLLPTTSTGPILSRTDILPPTELSNISAELVLCMTSKLPPIVLP